MAVEYLRDAKGRVEARDDERAPGVVGRGTNEKVAAADLERLIVSTWHPARVGRVQETIDSLLADGERRDGIIELQRFFDDAIGHLRGGAAAESWRSQERGNDREGSSGHN